MNRDELKVAKSGLNVGERWELEAETEINFTYA